MKPNYKIIGFWVLFCLFLLSLFVSIFSLLIRDWVGGFMFFGFALLITGFLLLIKKRQGKGIISFILAVILLAIAVYFNFIKTV